MSLHSFHTQSKSLFAKAVQNFKPRRPKKRNAIERRLRLAIGFVFEDLEARRMLTVAPSISAEFPTVQANAPFTLELNYGGDTPTSWTINWGDGTSGSPDTQTVTGSPPTVTHTYTIASSTPYTITASATDASGTYMAQNSLVNTFGGGSNVTGIGSSRYAAGIALDSSGNMFVAGEGTSGSNTAFELDEYTSVGTLNTTFGASGRVVSALGSGDSSASAIAVVPGDDEADEKILLAGQAIASDDKMGFALAEYNSDGTLDTSFGTDGSVIVDLGGLVSSAAAMAVTSSGDIILVGKATTSGDTPEFAVAEFTSTGSLDTSFNITGYHLVDVGGAGSFATAVVLSGSNIVVAGGTPTDPFDDPTSLEMAEFTSTGALNTSFGGSSTGMRGGNADQAGATALTVLSNGNILVGCYANLTEFTSTGAIDTSLLSSDTGEFVQPAVAVNSISELPNGEILVAGPFEVTRGGIPGFGVERLNADGFNDDSFAFNNGASFSWDISALGNTAFTEFPDIMVSATGIVVLPSGNIVVCGGDTSGNNTTGFCIAEYNPDGTADTSFGFGGSDYFNQGDSDFPTQMQLLSNGQDLLLSSNQYDPDSQTDGSVLGEFNLEDGTPETLFATAGVTPYLANNVDANAYVVLSNGDILVGSDDAFSATEDNTTLGLTEFNSNGSLNTSFGSGGTVIPAISGWAQTFGIDVLPGGSGNFIVVGSDGTQTMLAKFNSSGTLISSFGTDGVATSTAINPTGTLALSNGDILVAGTDSSGNFALAEFTTAGALNTSSFGTSGVASTTISPDTVVRSSIALAPSGEILAALSLGGDMAVAEFTAAGALNTSFGTGTVAGIAITSLATDVGELQDGSTNPFATALTVLPNGNILVAGNIFDDSSDDTLGVIEFDSSGEVVPTFGDSGTVTQPLTWASSGPTVITTLPNGTILIGGTLFAEGTNISENETDLVEFNPTVQATVVPAMTLTLVSDTPFSATFQYSSPTPLTNLDVQNVIENLNYQSDASISNDASHERLIGDGTTHEVTVDLNPGTTYNFELQDIYGNNAQVLNITTPAATSMVPDDPSAVSGDLSAPNAIPYDLSLSSQTEIGGAIENWVNATYLQDLNPQEQYDDNPDDNANDAGGQLMILSSPSADDPYAVNSLLVNSPFDNNLIDDEAIYSIPFLAPGSSSLASGATVYTIQAREANGNSWSTLWTSLDGALDVTNLDALDEDEFVPSANPSHLTVDSLNSNGTVTLSWDAGTFNPASPAANTAGQIGEEGEQWNSYTIFGVLTNPTTSSQTDGSLPNQGAIELANVSNSDTSATINVPSNVSQIFIVSGPPGGINVNIPYSNRVTAPHATPAPTNLRITNLKPSGALPGATFTIGWTDNSTVESGYNVYIQQYQYRPGNTDPDAPVSGAWTLLESTPADASSAAVTLPDATRGYWIKVVAVNSYSDSESADSNYVYAAILPQVSIAGFDASDPTSGSAAIEIDSGPGSSHEATIIAYVYPPPGTATTFDGESNDVPDYTGIWYVYSPGNNQILQTGPGVDGGDDNPDYSLTVDSWNYQDRFDLVFRVSSQDNTGLVETSAPSTTAEISTSTYTVRF